jgi:hypothetical protein
VWLTKRFFFFSLCTENAGGRGESSISKRNVTKRLRTNNVVVDERTLGIYIFIFTSETA